MKTTISRRIRFNDVVRDGHKGAAVEVPFDPERQWNVKKVPIDEGQRGYAARGTFGGVAFETHVVMRSKRYWVLVDAATLEAAGKGVGDAVEVELEPLVTS